MDELLRLLSSPSRGFIEGGLGRISLNQESSWKGIFMRNFFGDVEGDLPGRSLLIRPFETVAFRFFF